MQKSFYPLILGTLLSTAMASSLLKEEVISEVKPLFLDVSQGKPQRKPIHYLAKVPSSGLSLSLLKGEKAREYLKTLHRYQIRQIRKYLQHSANLKKISLQVDDLFCEKKYLLGPCTHSILFPSKKFLQGCYNLRTIEFNEINYQTYLYIETKGARYYFLSVLLNLVNKDYFPFLKSLAADRFFHQEVFTHYLWLIDPSIYNSVESTTYEKWYEKVFFSVFRDLLIKLNDRRINLKINNFFFYFQETSPSQLKIFSSRETWQKYFHDLVNSGLLYIDNLTIKIKSNLDRHVPSQKTDELCSLIALSNLKNLEIQNDGPIPLDILKEIISSFKKEDILPNLEHLVFVFKMPLQKEVFFRNKFKEEMILESQETGDKCQISSEKIKDYEKMLQNTLNSNDYWMPDSLDGQFLNDEGCSKKELNEILKRLRQIPNIIEKINEVFPYFHKKFSPSSRKKPQISVKLVPNGSD